MIRDMRRNGAQPKDTMHKAYVDMVTGMGVVIKDATINEKNNATVMPMKTNHIRKCFIHSPNPKSFSDFVSG